MKNIFLTALIIVIIGLETASAQQIPLFNSYTLNQFLINPSYAGINGKTNIFGINRIQYAGFDGAPVTYMLTADAGFKDKKFGVGGAVFSDRNNLIVQNGFQFTYAYNIKLGEKWNIGMGLNAGMVQWNLNFDQLVVEDYSEDVLSNVRSGATTFRSDVGLRLNSDKIEFGLTIPQMVTSKLKYSDYAKNANGQFTTIPHYIANLSYLLTLNEKLKIKPIVLVRGAKDIKPQIDVVGLVEWKNKVFATVGYRTNYAVTVGGGVRVGKGITFGYSYDRPMNNIGQYSSGSHEFIFGITLGGSGSDKDEPGNSLTKKDEARIKADIEKQVHDKLTIEFENKLNQELHSKINKAVDEKIALALKDRPASTTPSDGKTTPTSTATLSKEEIEKMKKEIEEKIRKQMDEDFNKLVDEKIKKAIESKPATPTTAAKPSKEEEEKMRKESEEKIRKEIEEKLRKELTDKINKAVDEKMQQEIKKAKDEEAKTPKEYKMTAKDKSTLDSLKMKNIENEKRIALLEKQLKEFPESDRVENSQLTEIRRIAHQNDIELKSFRAENKLVLDKAPDAKKSSKAEPSDETAKFILVLAAFKTQKDAQLYQKLAAQTFEFPGCKIIKPSQVDGWYFVYNKSFDKKSLAWEAHTKVVESKLNTPVFPWVYVME